MIELLPFDVDNVVGLRMQGKMSKQDFERVVAVIDDKLARHDKLRVYVEIESFEWPELDALLADFRFSLGHLGRFDREAVVIREPRWLGRLAAAAGAVMPGIEVRSFDFDRRDEAKRWIAEP